ncbi:phage portal protein [Paraburkholderia sp. BR10872]|uniref:anti-CBASS protein Acb1 family protein n=1 Tax=Paraburkholderia sp. BR10872 TaxID=3236989 RepID=UPI0034D2F733
MAENSTIVLPGSSLGTQLTDLLMADDLEPGSDVSYQLAKTIYLWHPLGAKMAELPVEMAMSQPRIITIPGSPESMVKEAFEREWASMNANGLIFQTKVLSRVYGVASLAYGAEGVPTDRPIDPKDLADLAIYFNTLDPLNTAGSLVLNQDPNAPDFLKHAAIAVSGKPYHRSRAVVVMNENPVYLGYTNSAFGYVGRSVYQRALFPLKSFIQSMITDDLVTLKAGLLIAKMKGAGSIVDNLMSSLAGYKRQLLQEAQSGNVLNIDISEAIETLNMQNTDVAMTTARKNIIENTASAAKMPAKLLLSESYAEGFGEGSEDAKDIARYINGVRKDMQPLYDFIDPIVMNRAWNPEFYKTVQNQFPEYRKIPYTRALYDWKNAFHAEWPNLLEEPESEKAKTEDVKLKAIIAMVEVLKPDLDPANKAILIDWAAMNFNECKTLIQHPLLLDIQALMEYTPPTPEAEPAEPRPFSEES